MSELGHFLLVFAISVPLSAGVSCVLLALLDRASSRCHHYGSLPVESVVPGVGVVARLCPRCSKQLSAPREEA